MKNRPLVSVIMPAYNAGSTIYDSIKSVLDQDYKELELFIVDDGSTDNTFEIVKRFRDSRIKYIFQKNPGFGSAASPRNLALQEINSKYVAFLDADDLWLPNKLDDQIRHFESLDKKVGLVYSEFSTFGTGQSQQIRAQADMHPYLFNDEFYDLILSNFIPLPTVILRSSALKEVGSFRTDLRGLEDWDLWLRISYQFSFSKIRKQHALYRISEKSMSSNKLEYANLELNFIKAFLKADNSIPREVFASATLYNEFKVFRLNITHSRYWEAVKSGIRSARAAFIDFSGTQKICGYLISRAILKISSSLNIHTRKSS